HSIPPSRIQSRIVGLDICRSVAIATVMLSHSITESGVYRHFDTDSGGLLWMGLVIQVAPPVFIILFGSILEIVYRPRIDAGQGREATTRLLTRAVQCYLLYVLTLVAMWAAGLNSFAYMVRCALFMGVTPYADILKFYALALAFAPLLLFLRTRMGLPALAIAALAIHATHPLISQIIVPGDTRLAEYANPVIGFLIGGNQTDLGGPSLLHGLTFVVWGMLLGRIVTILTREAENRKAVLNAIGALLVMFGVALAVMVIFWNQDVPGQTLRELGNMELRNQNHPIYFAYGMMGAMAAIMAFLVFYDANRMRFGRSIGFAGATSLFTFSFGNALLYLAPQLDLSPAATWAYAVFLFLLIGAQSYAFYWLQTRRPDEPHRLVTRFQSALAAMNQAVQRFAQRLAPRYAGLLGWGRASGQAQTASGPAKATLYAPDDPARQNR
ncbi:MAG: OpgC domain-containing protein, partial [Hyphomonas sp.]